MNHTLLKLPLIALLAFSFVFVACSDDEEDDPTPTEQIVGTWMVTEVYTQINNDPEQNVTADQPACNMDNLTTYSSDNTYRVMDNMIKCDSLSPDELQSGTWALIEADSKLVLDQTSSSSDNDTFDILSLTESRVELTQTATQAFGNETVTATVRRVAVKQ